MRKLVFVLGISVFMLSCGKGKSAKEIAEEICECSKKANGLPADDPNRKKEQDKCMDMQMEGWRKVKDDQKKALEFNDVIGKCATEQIQKSFGQ